jgi:hypothetical protein
VKWVTRRRIRVNRTATGWLIRRFLDLAAEFLFVEPADVAAVEAREGAIGFDAPGARYPHQDALGRCSFERLVEERVAGDAPLRRLAAIVHGADFAEEIETEPESAGLRAINDGFPETSDDDAETLDRALFLYDSLYAHLRRSTEVRGPRP